MNLYISIGAPGSGKSTYLRDFEDNSARFGPEIIVNLNADELRGLYGKDESDQSVSAQAFDFIAKAAHVLFRQGFSVAVDATSKDKRARAAFIEIAKQYGAKTVALVFDTPLDICLARNAARERVVPPDVVRRIYNQIQHPLPGEFDEVQVISNWKVTKFDS